MQIVYISLTNRTGGPQDILLMFDNTQNITTANINTLMTPYVSGVYHSHMMKVVGKQDILTSS